MLVGQVLCRTDTSAGTAGCPACSMVLYTCSTCSMPHLRTDGLDLAVLLQHTHNLTTYCILIIKILYSA